MAAVVAFVACKGDPAREEAIFCENAYAKCPEEPAPVTQDFTNCNAKIATACGGAMQLYAYCVSGKCTDAGRLDRLRVDRECGAFLDTYRSCTDAGATVPPVLPPPGTGEDAGVSDAS